MRFSSLQNALDGQIQPSTTPLISQLDSEEANRAWQSVIAAMDNLLQSILQSSVLSNQSSNQSSGLAAVDTVQGLIFSGPVPVFNHPLIQTHFQTCLWVPKWWTQQRNQLLPSHSQNVIEKKIFDYLVPIPDTDPLMTEQFCLVFTQHFSWFTLFTPDKHSPLFSYSFSPSAIQTLTDSLINRVEHYHPSLLSQLQQGLSLFPSIEPHYSIPEQFSRILVTETLQRPKPSVIVDRESWAVPASSETSRVVNIKAVQKSSFQHHKNRDDPQSEQDSSSIKESIADPNGFDIELLKAIAHEVRTPLTTIQTLTRLLLKRKDLPPDAIKRLTHIQQECVDQIDRFSLIFRAIELTTTPTASLNTSVTSISLQQIFEEKIERWTALLNNRSLEFQVDLPENFPPIAIRDPIVLDQVLTGLIEQLSHTLPFGSQINLLVSLAGDQLKIQLQSSIPPSAHSDGPVHKGTSILRAVGQLLMLQPDTGGLSLSLPATKQIFKFLGGKLTVRQSPPQGEIMTMFLPLSH